MVGFSADWLSLREPADHAARSVAVTRAALDAVPDRDPRILDLAAGTGSNLRYLTNAGLERTRSRSGGVVSASGGVVSAVDWLLVDRDPALLARVPAAPNVATRCLDLSNLDDRAIFEGRSLVTASALLDLVSEDWLRALAARCAAAGAAVLFALSYDGRIVCSPPDPDDGAVVALVNEHQRTDKGFGVALGPAATECAERCFRERGYVLQRAYSDWTLTPEWGDLQRRLIDGWAQAAAEMAPQQARIIDAWHERRQAHLAAGWSTIVVGHEDLAGLVNSQL